MLESWGIPGRGHEVNVVREANHLGPRPSGSVEHMVVYHVSEGRPDDRTLGTLPDNSKSSGPTRKLLLERYDLISLLRWLGTFLAPHGFIDHLPGESVESVFDIYEN